MRSIMLFLAAMVMPTSTVSAQTLAPRAVAESVATLVEEIFFDPARAAEIAGEVRSASAAGAWDDISDPLVLASALTEILVPHDRHFSVTWSHPGSDEGTAEIAQGQVRYGFDEQVRRMGNGFRRVEVLPANIGYIEMGFFAHIEFENPQDPVRASADAALALVAGTDAIIIDLRDNGGGSPAMVGYLTSAFTQPDAEIYNIFHSRQGTASEAPDIFYPHPRLDVPLYILISGRSGSAAEALPYTLQAAGRATIIGEASYGAANPGGAFDAGNGFELFVSDGSPINPITGGNWEGEGVQPDIATDAADALVRAQIHALDTLAASADTAYQLDIEWARTALSPPTAISVPLSEYSGEFGPYSLFVREGRLVLQQGRRPPLTLTPVFDDLFYRDANPLIRQQFVRAPDGTIVAVETQQSNGQIGRYERSDLE